MIVASKGGSNKIEKFMAPGPGGLMIEWGLNGFIVIMYYITLKHLFIKQKKHI